MSRSVVWTLLTLAGVMAIPSRLDAHVAPVRADSSGLVRSALSIRSDIDSAFVFIDARLAGRTPLTVDSLAAGTYRLKLVHPDVDNWLTGSLTDSVTLAPGERKIVTYTLGRYMSISTTPSGASLFIRDSLAGLTPILLWVDSTRHSSLFVLRKEGYQEATLRPWEVPPGPVDIGLVPDFLESGLRSPGGASSMRQGGAPYRLYVSGAGTILSGIAAALLKHEADDRQAQYLSTGDPGILAERNRLDNWSAVALVLTQISFGLFTYFLLSE